MSAVTGFKRLGLAVCVLIAGVFGALAVVSFLIPKDKVREAVKAEIRTVTGLDPQLRGEVSISLFPYGNVALTDVALGDGTGEPPLHAARLNARLAFFPLLTGQIEIADLTLSDPRILVQIDAEGRSNWSPLVSALTRAFDPRAQSKSDDLPSFSEIRINSGTIVVRDESRKIYEYFSSADLSLAWPAISRSFAVTGNVRYRGERMDVGITLGNFAAALQGERSALKIRVGSLPVKFAFDGAIATHPALKIEGSVSADSPSLRRALLWAGRKPLPGGGFERFALKAQTNVVGGTIALSQVNLELDGNSAEGVLTFAADGRQTLQGTLAADELDLSPYLSTIRLMAADRDWSRAPLDLEGLTAADLDLRLSAAKVTVGQVAFGRTAIATNLRAGQLRVTIGEARGFGGVIKGSIGLANADEGSASFGSQLVFENVQLERAIGDLFAIRRVEGRGNMRITLEGHGSSVYAITRTLDGEASLNAAKGALTGLNVEQLLRRLERRPLSTGSEFRSGRTPFEALNAQIKIAKGRATIQDVTLRGAGVMLALEGEASIPARDLDLKGVATLVAATPADRKPFELPFVVQGPWDDPIMLPDAQSLIQRSGAAAPLLRALQGGREAARPAAVEPQPAAPADAVQQPASPAAREAAIPAAPAATESRPAAPASVPQDQDPPAPRAQEAAAPAPAEPAAETPAEPAGETPAADATAAPATGQGIAPAAAPEPATPPEKPE